MKPPKTATQQPGTVFRGSVKEKIRFFTDNALFLRKLKYSESDNRWVWRIPRRNANDSNQSFSCNLHLTAFLSKENKNLYR